MCESNSRRPGFLATVAPESCLSRTGRQRRGVRTTRLRRPLQVLSSAAPSASTASRPAAVTIACRPSVGRDGESYSFDLGFGKTEIFLPMGLDRQVTSRPTDLPVGQIILVDLSAVAAGRVSPTGPRERAG